MQLGLLTSQLMNPVHMLVLLDSSRPGYLLFDKQIIPVIPCTFHIILCHCQNGYGVANTLCNYRSSRRCLLHRLATITGAHSGRNVDLPSRFRFVNPY